MASPFKQADGSASALVTPLASSSSSASSLANGKSSTTPRKGTATSRFDGAETGSTFVDPRIAEARRKLPIWVGRQSIIEAVKENDTVVVLGETGSGKTTQIPQYLYEAGFTVVGAKGKEGVAAGKGKGKGGGMIGITQPRRVAAISLAKRVAVEMGVPEPDRDERRTRKGKGSASKSSTVGYSIRFDDRTGQDTRIKFMTDGWLLREILSGRRGSKEEKRKHPANEEVAQAGDGHDDHSATTQHSLLEQYSVFIIDEAHERSVHTDVVLGLTKRIQRERKLIRQNWLKRKMAGRLTQSEEEAEPMDLKVVIMSATIDAEAFASFFSTPEGRPAPVLYIKGRQYPIRLFHSFENCLNWMESCKKLIVQINEMPPGDVLIFMTGAEEIESFASELHDLNKGLQLYAEGMGKPKAMSLMVVKLYAALGGEAIRKCFMTTPPGCRKIVLATNIAETSITISGIKFVIDCGLAKERTFRTSGPPDQGSSLASVSGASMEMLEIRPISKSAARQRAGRAGRETGGSCYRLYKEEVFDKLQESTLPEILRTELSSVVLDVFAMGINPVDFDWLDRPDEEGLRAAVVNLVELGALEMTASGKDGKKGGLKLTKLGGEMATLPLLPQLSKTLLSARDCADSLLFSHALDLVSILSTERRSILVEPTSRKDEESSRKRDEADRARERLSHPSGDHATQLKALHAFFHAQQESGSATTNGKGKAATATGAAAAKIKEWCTLNFVNLKAVRETIRIRSQLHRVCLRQGWLPSVDMNGVGPQHQSRDELEDHYDDDSDSDGELLVTRAGEGPTLGNGYADAKEDYGLLRRCLIQGKRVNTAFRQGESNLYQRAHGGSERFKIHPSSSLLFRKPLPSVIFFEEIFVTTQIFARTVSAAEASWLTDLSSEVKSRRSLHQVALQSKDGQPTA